MTNNQTVQHGKQIDREENKSELKHSLRSTYFFFLSNRSLISCSSSVSSPDLELEEDEDDDDDEFSSSSSNLLALGDDGLVARTEAGQNKTESSVTNKSSNDALLPFIFYP